MQRFSRAAVMLFCSTVIAGTGANGDGPILELD